MGQGHRPTVRARGEQDVAHVAGRDGLPVPRETRPRLPVVRPHQAQIDGEGGLQLDLDQLMGDVGKLAMEAGAETSYELLRMDLIAGTDFVIRRKSISISACYYIFVETI